MTRLSRVTVLVTLSLLVAFEAGRIYHSGKNSRTEWHRRSFILHRVYGELAEAGLAFKICCALNAGDLCIKVAMLLANLFEAEP